MPKDEDFQKQIFNALEALKQEIKKLDERFNTRIEALEKSTTIVFQALKSQISAKGTTCIRVAKNSKNEKYCTAWELKSIPKGTESNYILVGGRYHPKPGTTWCYSCIKYEKQD